MFSKIQQAAEVHLHIFYTMLYTRPTDWHNRVIQTIATLRSPITRESCGNKSTNQKHAIFYVSCHKTYKLLKLPFQNIKMSCTEDVLLIPPIIITKFDFRVGRWNAKTTKICNCMYLVWNSEQLNNTVALKNESSGQHSRPECWDWMDRFSVRFRKSQVHISARELTILRICVVLIHPSYYLIASPHIVPCSGITNKYYGTVPSTLHTVRYWHHR
jgi:hypothetical protein